VRAALGATVLLLLLAAGCSKREPEAGPAQGSDVPIAGEVLPEAERTRGTQACDVYVKRLCGCADRDAPTWAAPCQLARSLPEALALSLDLSRHPDITPKVLTQLQQGARKLVAKCIEETAALDAKGCR